MIDCVQGTVVSVGGDYSHMNLLSGLGDALDKTCKEDFFLIPKQVSDRCLYEEIHGNRIWVCCDDDW